MVPGSAPGSLTLATASWRAGSNCSPRGSRARKSKLGQDLHRLVADRLNALLDHGGIGVGMVQSSFQAVENRQKVGCNGVALPGPCQLGLAPQPLAQVVEVGHDADQLVLELVLAGALQGWLLLGYRASRRLRRLIVARAPCVLLPL